MRRLLITSMLLLLPACERATPDTAAPAVTPDTVAPAVVVTYADSSRTIEVELARFREGLTAPRALQGGERSRDALVSAFLDAIEHSDTTRLRELHLSAAEFAWFYYPYTLYTHPPYQQAPGMVWLLTTQNSQKGITRVLRRLAGAPLDVRGYRCTGSEPQDVNTLHIDCGVLLGDDPNPQRFFGSIIERDGRYKFVSYANQL